MLKEKENCFVRKMLLISVFLAVTLLLLAIPFSNVKAETLENEKEPKVEFRAVELKEVNETNQLIVEVWLKDLDFMAMDLRIQYEDFLETSDMTTNEVIVNDPEDENLPANFTFEDEFGDYMDLVAYQDINGGLQLVYSLKFEIPESVIENSKYLKQYVKQDENQEEYKENYIAIEDYVLFGKLSFKVGEGKITKYSIDLQEADTVPKTGIAITTSDVEGLEDPSIFEFIVNLASDDAYLTNLVLSSGEVNEENPDESTYKEYTLTPEFTKEELIYELTLLEYVDNMNIMVTQSDEKSTMKIKVPKRNEDNELVYDSDGTTIIYEEKEILNNVPLEFTLNKLGEPDTEIGVIVTAEDEETTKSYKVVIKRPYGTIKGSIQLGNGLRDSIQASYGTYVEYVADATIYESEQFNWDGVITKETSLEDLSNLQIKAQVKTNKDDGSYEIYVIPGEYDLILEKLGFLQSVITKIKVAENEVIDLGNKILYEGDTDRTGIIDLDDIVGVVALMDSMKDDGMYQEQFDFGQKGFVAIDDIVSVVANMDKLIDIQEY